MPREHKAGKKMQEQNIHRTVLQLKTNQLFDKPSQHPQRELRTSLARAKLSSAKPSAAEHHFPLENA